MHTADFMEAGEPVGVDLSPELNQIPEVLKQEVVVNTSYPSRSNRGHDGKTSAAWHKLKKEGFSLRQKDYCKGYKKKWKIQMNKL